MSYHYACTYVHIYIYICMMSSSGHQSPPNGLGGVQAGLYHILYIYYIYIYILYVYILYIHVYILYIYTLYIYIYTVYINSIYIYIYTVYTIYHCHFPIDVSPPIPQGGAGEASLLLDLSTHTLWGGGTGRAVSCTILCVARFCWCGVSWGTDILLKSQMCFFVCPP